MLFYMKVGMTETGKGEVPAARAGAGAGVDADGGS